MHTHVRAHHNRRRTTTNIHVLVLHGFRVCMCMHVCVNLQLCHICMFFYVETQMCPVMDMHAGARTHLRNVLRWCMSTAKGWNDGDISPLQTMIPLCTAGGWRMNNAHAQGAVNFPLYFSNVLCTDSHGCCCKSKCDYDLTFSDEELAGC